MDTADFSLFLDVPHFGDLLNDSKFSPLEDDCLFFSPRFDESEFEEAVKNCIYPDGSLSSFFQDEAEKIDEEERKDESEKKDESEEEVDIETVDDCAPLTANIETRQNFDCLRNGQSPSRAVNLCKCDDSSADTFGDLINFAGIEADDLESLMEQFDSASNFQSPLLASSVAPLSFLLSSPEPTQLPPTEPSDFMQFLPTCGNNGSVLEHAADATLPVEKISDIALPVVSCGVESIEPYQLSAGFFDKIPDHEYCRMSMAELLDITGQEPSEQSSTVDLSDSAAASANHKYTAEPYATSYCQMNDAADSAVAAAVTSPLPEVCRDVKTGQSRSLLRPRAIAKSSAAATLPATSLQAAIVPAARSIAMRPSAPRPSCSSSTSSRTGVELSSTATTSQSSCSDSGSDSEFGPRGVRPRQSRPSRCRSRNRRGSNPRDCRSPSSSSSSSSCSTSGTRSRSRSRSRVRSHSSRRRFEKEKQEEKRRAMTERRVVYVGNIPSNFKKADLRRCFSTFGEIEDVSVHFRDHGDNYGFVTFVSPRNAVVAIEKGGNVQGRQFKLCFGGRRIFCETEYADLDGCAAAKEEWALTQSRRRDDFESLLRQSMRRIKKD